MIQPSTLVTQKFHSQFRSRTILVRDLNENKTKKVMKGIAFEVENLAYDWSSGNLYWTDSVFNWIMVIDSTYQHYTPVYVEDVGTAHGLAVHSKERLAFDKQLLQISSSNSSAYIICGTRLTEIIFYKCLQR